MLFGSMFTPQQVYRDIYFNKVKKMKVKELKFEPHPSDTSGTRAIIMFKNGFGASVITGTSFYTNDSHPYEVAVIDNDGVITYDTEITNDVLGFLSEDDVNKVLADIEALKPRQVLK